MAACNSQLLLSNPLLDQLHPTNRTNSWLVRQVVLNWVITEHNAAVLEPLLGAGELARLRAAGAVREGEARAGGGTRGAVAAL